MDARVQEYMDAVTDERRPLLDKLHALILGLYPEAQIAISYGVPGYRVGSRRMHIGYWKGGASLYPGRAPLAAFRLAYPAIKTGAGTINLKLTDALPDEALERVIRQALGGGE